MLPEVPANLIEPYAPDRLGVQPVSRVRRKSLGVRRGNALEGVGDPDRPVGHVVALQGRAHEDCRASAPDPRLDEVARHIFADDRLRRPLQLLEAARAEHRERGDGPAAASS